MNAIPKKRTLMTFNTINRTCVWILTALASAGAMAYSDAQTSDEEVSPFLERAVQTRVGASRAGMAAPYLDHVCRQSTGARENLAWQMARSIGEEGTATGPVNRAVERKLQIKLACVTRD